MNIHRQSVTETRAAVQALLSELRPDAAQLKALSLAIDEYTHATAQAILMELEVAASDFKEQPTTLPRPAMLYRHIGVLRQRNSANAELVKINAYYATEIARLTDFYLSNARQAP